MADSEDEFKPLAGGGRGTRGRLRTKAAAPAAEGVLRPPEAEALPPGPDLSARDCARSRSKRACSSAVEPSAKKARKATGRDGAGEELLVAAARPRSRSRRLEEAAAAAELLRRGRPVGGGPRRAERRSRAKPARPPPLLLLQDPEKARKEVEERVAMLLSEAGEFPRTPPLSVSRLAVPRDARRRSLWEFSALAEPCAAPGGFSAEGFTRPASQTPGQSPALSAFLPHSGHVRPPEMELVISETEPFQGRVRGDLQGNLGEPKEKLAHSQKDAEMLEDLMELASEGLTFTQWDQEVQQLQGAGQELVLGKVLQSRFVQSLEKKLPSRSCHQEFPLGLLATAFRGMVNNPHLSDVQFQVDSGEVFYAHAFVLYARCPQLLEVVDRRGFTVVEDGGVETCRVLLKDTQGEAVRVFLNYLYAADHAIPRHVLPDVAALATRFGVRELVALCGGQSGLASSAGEEEEEENIAEEKNRAETFEELLKSMWQDEEDDTLLKCVHLDHVNSIRDHVSEPELEEIYEFAATQRIATPGVAEQETGSCESQPQQGRIQAVPGETCPRKGLEETTPTVVTRECKGDGAREAPRDASGDRVLGRLPLVAQQDAEEMRSLRAAARRLSPADNLLGLAEASEDEDPLAFPESPVSVTPEGFSKSPCARKPSVGAALQDTPTRNPPSPLQGPLKDFQLALGMFFRDRQVLASPLLSSPLVSSPKAFSHTCPLTPSASRLLHTAGSCSSFWDSEQEHAGRRNGRALGSSAEKPFGQPRSLGHLEADLIVLLDSDEEVELNQVVYPGFSGLWPGACEHRQNLGVDFSDNQGPSPHPLEGTRAPVPAAPICDEASSPQAKSSQLWGLSSGPEEGRRGEGEMLLVPDTPLLSRVGATPSLKSRSKEQQLWANQTMLCPALGSFQERPPAQNLLSLCNRPLLPQLATCLPGRSLSPLRPDVVVVDDSEEEQEAALPCSGGTAVPGAGLPISEEAVDRFLPFVGLAGTGSSRGNALEMNGRRAEGSPLVVAHAVASRAASSCFGEASSLERLQRHQEQADRIAKDSDNNHAAAPVAQELPALEPVVEAACDLACWTPVTPMPSYSIMETPKLKEELSRFGVRALPKRQMVLKLKEIFHYTHSKVGADCTMQVVPSQLPRLHNPAKTAFRTVASSTHQKQLPGFRQMFPWSNLRDPSEGGDQRFGHMVEPHYSEAGSGQPKNTTLSAAAFAVGGSRRRLSLTASQESTGSSVTDSAASVISQSSSSGFESSTLVLAEQEHLSVSQAAACEAQKLAALQYYLRSKPTFFRQILLYQPIELAVLQAELKQNGIRIAMGKLLDFLDVLCITFTTAEARREKQHHRGAKKKGRRWC